jgi:hypothetical protein
MATPGQELHSAVYTVYIGFYKFYALNSVQKRLFQACTNFVHCGINLGGAEDLSAWKGRATGACMLSTDACVLGQQAPHFLRLEKVFAVPVSKKTMEAMLHNLQQCPDNWRHDPCVVMPCFGIRYPTMSEIVLDLFRSAVGVPTEPLGSNEKLQCAQFCLMTLLFLLKNDGVYEHPPPVLSRLAKRGCSLTPDALYHAVKSLCQTYPQIYESRLACEDFGGSMYLDTPQDMVPLSVVTG